MKSFFVLISTMVVHNIRTAVTRCFVKNSCPNRFFSINAFTFSTHDGVSMVNASIPCKTIVTINNKIVMNNESRWKSTENQMKNQKKKKSV